MTHRFDVSYDLYTKKLTYLPKMLVVQLPEKHCLDSNTNPPPWFNYEQLLMHV